MGSCPAFAFPPKPRFAFDCETNESPAGGRGFLIDEALFLVSAEDSNPRPHVKSYLQGISASSEHYILKSPISLPSNHRAALPSTTNFAKLGCLN